MLCGSSTILGQLDDSPWTTGMRSSFLPLKDKYVPSFSNTNLAVFSGSMNLPTSTFQLEHNDSSQNVDGLSTFSKQYDNLYDDEDARRKSFLFAPHCVLRISEALLEAGFYYSGECDGVKCHQCHVQLGNWKDSTSPLVRHQTESPTCQFMIKKLKSTNKLNTNETSKSTCLIEDQKQRAKTFKNWPTYAKMTSHEVNEAGMYFDEDSQCVMCPLCSLKSTLIDLEKAKNAKTHHSNVSPQCSYVKDNITGNNAQKRWYWHQDPAVVTLLELGIDSKIVQKAAFHLRRKLDGNELVAQDLLEIVHQIQDDGTNKTSQIITEPDGLNKLRQENTRLRTKANCLLCDSARADMLVLPCKHLATCADCGEEVDNCVQCDKEILATVKVYFG